MQFGQTGSVCLALAYKNLFSIFWNIGFIRLFPPYVGNFSCNTHSYKQSERKQSGCIPAKNPLCPAAKFRQIRHFRSY